MSITKYHNFDINVDQENEASVTLIEMYDSNIGYSAFDLTIAEGELSVDEDELKAELEDLVETENGSGETTISVEGENLYIFYEIEE
jgi:hypothetical protein